MKLEYKKALVYGLKLIYDKKFIDKHNIKVSYWLDLSINVVITAIITALIFKITTQLSMANAIIYIITLTLTTIPLAILNMYWQKQKVDLANTLNQ